MTVSVFYPASTPTAPVDGLTTRNLSAETFANKRAGAGEGVDDGGGTGLAARLTTNGTNFDTLHRGYFTFDAASIPDGDTKDSATFEVAVINVISDFAEGGTLVMLASTPASNSALATGDHALTAWPSPLVEQATARLTVSTLSVLDPDGAYNLFTLNATGRGNVKILAGEITKFGLMTSFDFDNSGPVNVANKSCQVRVAFAEEALAGEKRPRLTVTHTSPTTFIPRAMVF